MEIELSPKEVQLFQRAFYSSIRTLENVTTTFSRLQGRERLGFGQSALLLLGLVAGVGSVLAYSHRGEIAQEVSRGFERILDRVWSVDPQTFPDFS